MAKVVKFPNFFPIGYVYISVVNQNPSKWFGGTWVEFAKGRTLVGVDTSQTEFNTVKKTGGEKTNILTINQIPEHVHSGLYIDGVEVSVYNGSAGSGYGLGPLNSGYKYGHLQSSKAGGGQAHNNLQPYITVYMFVRTA